jgi:hypothetical protein
LHAGLNSQFFAFMMDTARTFEHPTAHMNVSQFLASQQAATRPLCGPQSDIGSYWSEPAPHQIAGAKIV